MAIVIVMEMFLTSVALVVDEFMEFYDDLWEHATNAAR